MRTVEEDTRRRRHAARRLLTLSVAGFVVVGVAIGVVAPGRHRAVLSAQPPLASTVLAPAVGGPWNPTAENALAQAPMPQLPVEQAQPQPLSTDRPPAPITMPPATSTSARGIPEGFPDTQEGALGQLAAVTEAALDGADPTVVDQSYQDVSVAGAPDPASSTPHHTAVDLRAAAGLPGSGPIPGLTVTYTPAEGLIKGTTDAGRFAVVCVLGEVDGAYQDRSAQAGLGICEGMRWVNGQWRISPTHRAAAAPSAWPGSAAAQRVGYREISHAP